MKLTKDHVSTLLTCCRYSIRHISEYHDRQVPMFGEPKNTAKESSLKPIREAMDVLQALKKELK